MTGRSRRRVTEKGSESLELLGLVVRDLVAARGGLPVLHGVSLAAEAGAVTVLLGANGAGKSTLLDAIAGTAPAQAGTIRLRGERIDGLRPVRRTGRGLGYVEQGRTVFSGLTVEENFKLTPGQTPGGDPLFSNLPAGSDIPFGLFPELRSRRGVPAGLLSGGEQQMVVIARALLSRPSVLMLDEMSLGLAPIIVRRLMRTVRELADEGMAVLLVEQFAALALDIGDAAYVLRRGRVVWEGSCAALRADPGKLHSAYLGATS